MIQMSTHSVPWRARLGHAVSRIPAKGWAAIVVGAVVVVASSFIHPALPGMLLVGLGGSVVMGNEKN